MRTTTKKRIKRRGKDRFEPRKTFINGELYWQVNLPREWDDERKAWKQKRRTVKDHEEAKTVAEQARVQWKNSGKNGFAIPDQLRIEALAAARVLEPLGATILEAAKFYADHLRRENQSEGVANVVKEILVSKKHDNLRPRYLSDLKSRLTRFAEKFGDRKIASLTAGEIDNWLRSLQVKPLTRNSIRLRLGVLFAYAMQRGWCQKNPIPEVRKIRANAPAIGILTPQQFAKVLEAATEATLPYWLLGGFSGLRRAEIERLEWKDVHFDSALIEVTALKAKTASRRFVQIQDNLAAWLEPYIGRTGNVCPPNLRKLLEADRTAAGLKKWPSNALRHGFASYHLAKFHDAAKLALELGHTKQDLLFRHYRELVKPEQAEKYWNIRPATQTNLVAISA
jgi:integrase